MFENKIYEGIHYSRFVASFGKKGEIKNYKFKKWLKQLIINGKPIPEDVINEIYKYATNGKLELEENAFRFLNSFGNEKL